MSKITFRADDALVERLDDLDASKSEVMREALREFLDRQPGASNPGRGAAAQSDGAVAAQVDEALEGRMSEQSAREVNVNITVDTPENAAVEAGGQRVDDGGAENACHNCGEHLGEDHTYCPNCGEEHHRQPRCECGEEVSGEWAFCPGCGRRSPTSDVLDRA